MPALTLFQTAPEEEQPSSDSWNIEFLDDLTGGVNTAVRPKALALNQMAKVENLRIAKERIVNDLGYKTFNQVIVGSPRADYQYFKKDGTSKLILLTNARFYLHNSATDEWEFVSNGTSTTMAVAAVATDTTIDVVSSTGFVDGSVIGIRLDNAKQHMTTVNGAPAGNVITLTVAMPSAAAIGNVVVEGELLTGSDDIQPSLTTWAGTDAMYFTNGKDVVKKYDGTSTSDVSGLPANTKARIVIVHVNQLILLHTEEGGTAHPQRQRWSDVGSDTGWSTSINFNDHLDSEDQILSADRLGVYLVIYKERSIIRQEYVGSPDQTWHWVTTITGEGTVSADSVVNLGDEHIFWGNTNIYRYKAGFDLEPIGDSIFEGVFSAVSGDINPANRERIFGLYVEELDDVFFFYPHGANTFPKKALRYNVGKNSWMFRTFSFNVTGFGFFSTTDAVKWNTAVGIWSAQVGPWLGSALQSGAPTLHLCDQSNLRVYDYDFLTVKDNGVAISYELITRTWYVPNRDLRFDRYEITMKGTNILVEISFDEGNSYETLGTVTPGSLYNRQRFHKQKIARALQFRFTGSADFGVSDLAFRYKRETTQEA